MHALITRHQPQLEKVCKEFHVQRLELFGSGLRGSFDPDQSDFDFLVEFGSLASGEYASSFFGLKDALEQLFGRSVDLVVASAIRNPYFRHSIEQSKMLLYAA